VAVVDQYTTYTAGSTQYTWLANDLATTSKPWKFVVLHEPGWSSGGGHENNTTVQTALQPLFKQYGVQLVIGGHNHYYARGVVDGIQHLTLGGGGAPLYSPASGQTNIVKTDQSYHHVEFDINGNTMFYTARRSDGTVIESLNIFATVTPCYVINAATPGSCYRSFGAAYQVANSGDTIKAVAKTFAETLIADREIKVSIQGGYESTFTTAADFSCMQGLFVMNGMVSVSNIELIH
jgi:hypothetical protein